MIKVLLIEDSLEDAAKIKAALTGSKDVYLDSFDFVCAETLFKGIEELKKTPLDVILLDLGLPDARGFDGVDLLKKEFPLTPVIVLTKQREDTLVAVEAVRRGAQDYFSKTNLSDGYTLERIIRYAIERKKHEEEIVAAREQALKAKDEALKASKAKSEFLSSMSHDIRTPLNCIIGVADLLSRAKLSEDEIHYVQMLNKASDNLLSLINDILDLSKIESGLIKISKKDFDLVETVEGVLDFNSARAYSKGLDMVFKIEPDVPRKIIGDAEHLSQILINLLGNAIKFTKKGQVLLHVSNVIGDQKQTTVRFAVKDSGIGIPPDKLTAIFESFTQLDNKDTSLKRQGSGLGLSICKRLVELMNGTINVQSELGKGSIFQFDIPFDIPAKAPLQKVIPALDLENMQILVVDDNIVHCENLKELLVFWGASVQCVQSSVEALNLISNNRSKVKFDIALLDARMPGIATGGIELAAKIKNEVKIIILMLPTNHRYGDIEKIKSAGIKHYFFKPTKPEQLAQIISESVNAKLTMATFKPQPDSQSLEKPLHILVADDSEENRQLIEAYCKDTGLVLEMAEDGRQAFEKFKQQHFDLVLMDIQMPSMNGYEALFAIREWEDLQKKTKVPILALTAFALKEEADRCLSAGFKAHVTKPIRKNELIKTIKKFAA